MPQPFSITQLSLRTAKAAQRVYRQSPISAPDSDVVLIAGRQSTKKPPETTYFAFAQADIQIRNGSFLAQHLQRDHFTKTLLIGHQPRAAKIFSIIDLNRDQQLDALEWGLWLRLMDNPLSVVVNSMESWLDSTFSFSQTAAFEEEREDAQAEHDVLNQYYDSLEEQYPSNLYSRKEKPDGMIAFSDRYITEKLTLDYPELIRQVLLSLRKQGLNQLSSLLQKQREYETALL